MNLSELQHSYCKACKNPIKWIKTKAGKWQPVDAEPFLSKGGEKMLYNEKGELLRKVTKKNLVVYTAHHATCSSKFRKGRQK